MSRWSSVVPLLVMPLALGAGLLRRQTRIGTCWWFGVVATGLTVVAGYGIGLPQRAVLGVVFAAALALSWPALRGRRRVLTATPRDVLYSMLLVGLLFPLALAIILRTLDYPALGADAIEIWYAKAKGLYAWLPFSDLPFRNYPNLGPACWMTVLQWVGPERENIGRLVFALCYVFWLLSLLELSERPYPWASAVALPALGVLFLDFRFTIGDQDGFVMMAAGMAALFIVKSLKAFSPGGQSSGEGMTALAHDRQDCLLAAFFAGALGLIKQEGAVLGFILMGTWVVVLLAHEHPSRRRDVLRRMLPAGVIYVVVAAMWPSLLLLHGIDITEIQGQHFTASSIVHALDNLDRWPAIRAYLTEYYGSVRMVLLASLLLSIATASLFSSVRTALIFLWGVLGVHSLFVVFVFLSTREPVEWHLRTAFDRLMLQQRFVFVTLLWLTVGMLSARLWPETARRPGVRSDAWSADELPGSEVEKKAAW